MGQANHDMDVSLSLLLGSWLQVTEDPFGYPPEWSELVKLLLPIFDNLKEK